MPVEIIIPIAAVIVVFLLLGWLLKVFKASVKTMLAIAAIFIVLQIVFDIDSQQIFQGVMQIIDRIAQVIFN